jgi:hypothetical protein
VSDTFDTIRRLVATHDVRISEHGYDELADDELTAREVVAGVGAAILVEDYPDFPKGPSVLLMQLDSHQQPIHVVWGIPKGHQSPAVLVTAYRPDPARWNPSLTERK